MKTLSIILLLMMPMLTSAQSETFSDSTRTVEVQILKELRDTTADGRSFYISQMFFQGEEGFFTGISGVRVIREIHAQKTAAEQENTILKDDLKDCEEELKLADNEIRAEHARFIASQEMFTLEVEKNANNTLVLKDYEKKANAGKVMTIVGGIGIGIGVAGILYAVIVTQLP